MTDRIENIKASARRRVQALAVKAQARAQACPANGASRKVKQRTDKYSKALVGASKLRDRNCCALIAVAVITGKKFEDVYDMFRAKGRRRGKGTPMYMTHAVLRDCGFTLELQKRKPKTVNQCEAKLSKTKMFLIHTSCHVLAMRAGEVHDHSRGSRRIPLRVYHVSRKRK